MAQPIYGCLLFLSVACGTFSEAEQGEQRKITRRKKKPLGHRYSLYFSVLDGFFISCLSLTQPGEVLRGGYTPRIYLRSLILIIKHRDIFTC